VKLRIGVVAAAAAALIAAGCGGSAGGNEPGSGGAMIAPGTTAAYMSVDSNLDSAAWTKAKALLDRFPGKDDLIADLRSSLRQEGLDWETDVEPAIGDELDLVWLDFQNEGENAVGMTKPDDAAKFDALLAKTENPPVHEVIDGWTVFAESRALLDRFDKARADSGTLQDESTFGDHFDNLAGDSIARAWVRGGPLQAAFDKRLRSAGVPGVTTTSQFGAVDALTAAVTPQSEGIQISSTASGDLNDPGDSYHADLPTAVPGGAILYLSFNDVGTRINKLIDSLGSSVSNFDQQRAQIELVLGYPLSDVFNLLSGEGALAVYENKGGTPAVLFVADLSDESKAQNILNRLASLAEASGTLEVQPVQIGSVQAKEIALGNGRSLYVAIFDGRLVTATSRSAIEDMQGNGPKLADDAVFKDAVSAADMPDQTHGFLYADTQEVLEYGFDYAASAGMTVPQGVKENTAPLRGLLLHSSKDGSDFTVTGFVGIK